MSNGGIIGPVNDPIIQTNSTVTAFTASGCFTARTGQPSVVVAVVAGGGGSAIAQGGNNGGGGAGGFRTCSSFPIPGASIPITIGAGGGTNTQGTPSIFSTITATGGGRSADRNGTNTGPLYNGGPGGSGGGGSQDYNCVVSQKGLGNSPPVSPPQGNDGGQQPSLPSYAGSGGGGAGGVGQSSQSGGPNFAQGGAGGIGSPVTSLFGPSQPFYLPGPAAGYFAGGGGGSSHSFASPSARPAGGLGGGGCGASPAGGASNGTANSGGGSGGTGENRPGGGTGGSGIVIVQQPAFAKASGVWSLQCQYNFKKNNQWT